MEVEVVAAGVAVDEFGGDGYEGGEEDDGWADEAVPTWFIPRSQKRDRGHPRWNLFRLLRLRLPEKGADSCRYLAVECGFQGGGPGLAE